MVNTERTIKRERTRLRKSQNPQQLDFKRMKKAQMAKTKYWASKKRSTVSESIVVEDKKKPKKDKPKKDKEPELEVVDEELEELYDYDDEEVDEEVDEEEEVPE
ncbi:MAG: hypothetical protein ACW98Y_17505 [Candidatus Thorarchaeota archaeon]|jgi:hypothetical protein